MIYPKNFEQKIGFDIVRQMIADFCLSPMGIQYVDKIRFTSNFDLLVKLLNQVDEFRQLLQREGNFPSDDYFDLIPELTRISIEGTYIEQQNLFDLKSSLQTIVACVDQIRKQESENFPSLIILAEPVHIDKDILRKIERIIDDKGQIKDTASSELADIRKQIISRLHSVDKKINTTLKQAKKSGWINEDTEVTIRNGRLVIPVPAAYKRQLRGFIHDESATGQTVYIEPEEIFDTNNEIRELQAAERREMIKILKDFTAFVRPHIPSLMEGYRFLGLIDFIRAKTRFANLINGICPEVKNEPGFDWLTAVHPLLFLSHQKQKKQVVPLEIKLNNKHRILVISGPNAGGKSVCLKTIGLLQYMLQCGLLIPVNEGSVAGVFSHLFIDIGDEQSLENDLSTYSSHLLNMKYFVLNANEETLFLIDEFGAGTEPQLGGAIAEAILEKLNEKRAFGVVTTHYSNLKLIAKEGNGIANGAMLFDMKAMQPLYRLQIGNPGSSFAFEIARNIGFPKNILKNAEGKTGKKQLDFDQQLQQLDIEKKELEKKQKEIQVADDFLSEMIDKYEKLNKDLESRKSEIISSAKKEATEILSKSNKLIENTILQIRKSQAEKKQTKNLREKLKEDADKIVSGKGTITHSKGKDHYNNKVINDQSIKSDEQEVPLAASADPSYSKGDYVRIVDQDVYGEVIDVREDTIVVSFNSVTLVTSPDKVEHSEKTVADKFAKKTRNINKTGIFSELNDKLANFKLQIDVRGKRAEEALSMVRQYIDDALLLNATEIRILHGKGFGILRTMIHDYLRTQPQIKQFKDEHVERGGQGITIVILK